MATRKALCVGINQFQNYPQAALRGCVNDAMEMASILKTFYGFGDTDITLLTDTRATKSNIMSQLRDMVEGAKAGRYHHLVFSLSSHGTEVKDRSGDERIDEAFCPHDLDEANGEWAADHIILDDELGALFNQVPSNVTLEVYLDTCHSGTGLRKLELQPGRKARYLPPPTAMTERERDLPRMTLDRRVSKKEKADHYLWAACHALQTSADAHLGGDWHGAFTYFFCDELRKGGATLTRQELIERVKNDLKSADFDQRPQLEADPTRLRSPIVHRELTGARF